MRSEFTSLCYALPTLILKCVWGYKLVTERRVFRRWKPGLIFELLAPWQFCHLESCQCRAVEIQRKVAAAHFNRQLRSATFPR